MINQYKEYPIRFLVVLLFALVQLMTSVLLNTFTPIAAYVTVICGENHVIVNLAALLFTLMHPIFTFPAAYIIDTFGTLFGITIGSLLGILGTAIRMFISAGFHWAIIGQVIIGIGRPFILNCQAKISANWFKAESRGKVTQILTLVLNVSLILGIIIPGIIFHGYEPNEQNIDQGTNLLFTLMLIEAIMGFVCFGANIIFQRKNPPTPPSESGSIKRQAFSVSIPKILRNKNYILLLCSFGCFFGIFNALSIILSYLLQPWFGDDDLPLAVAAVGGSPIISGILGVMVIGSIQRKSGKYKKWIIICMIGSSVAISLFYPLLQIDSIVVMSLISAFNSFFLIPLVPIMLQLGCELVFPVGQGSAVGLLFACGNLFGFLFGLLLSIIVKGNTKEQTAGGLGFCFGIFIIGLILILFMKQQKNRQKAEMQLFLSRKSLSQKQETLLSDSTVYRQSQISNSLL